MTLTMRGGRVVEMRRSKYGNRKAPYRGRVYDSAAEARYAMWLDSELAAGRIAAWEAQYPLDIYHNRVAICRYYADFRVRYPNGKVEFVDVKGVRTEIYRLKKKLVKAFYGVDIKEIDASEI